MTIEAKLLYLKKVGLRYKKATKKRKSEYLDEAMEICDYSRKHLIRLLNQKEPSKSLKRGRKASSFETWKNWRPLLIEG